MRASAENLYDLLLARVRSHQFARNVGTTFATQVAVAGFTILALALIGRRLGSGSKGLLELTILLPNMLSLLLSGGIYLSNAYFSGTQQYDVDTLASHSVSFTLISSAIGVALILLSLYAGLLNRFMPGVPTLMLLLGTLLVPVRLLSDAFQGILQGRQDIWKINLAGVVRVLTFFSLVVFTLLVLDGDTTEIVVVFVLSYLVQMAILSRFVLRLGGSFRPRWRMAFVKRALNFGLRAQIGNILQFYNYRLDVFILNVFLGASGVGIYNVSTQLAELLWFLPNATGYVMLPKAAASTRETMARFTPRILAATLGLSAVAAVFVAVTGGRVILLLFGPDFSDAYYPLLALLPGVVLFGGAKVLANEIVGRGYPHYNTITAGIGLVATIVLNLTLIPRLGLLGAAVASTCVYSLTAFVTLTWYFVIRGNEDRL